MIRRRALLLLGLLAALPAVRLAALEVLEVDDLMTLATVSDPQISPDGSRVAYVVLRPDLERNVLSRDVWLVGSDGQGARQLTTAPGRDDTPRWSPDGKTLAFLSDRGERLGIWSIAADGGEARLLVEPETGVVAFQWSPRGDALAFVAPDSPAESSPRDAWQSDLRVVDEELRMMRLYLVAPASGEITPLTDASRSIDDFSWSPDGEEIVFSARPTPKVPDMFHADLYKLRLADRALTPLVVRAGADASPRWSPDGKSIAFTSNHAGNDWISNWHAYVVPAAGGEPRNVSAAFDEFIIEVSWSADCGRLYFAAWQGVTTQLFSLAVAIGEVEQLSTGLYSHGLRYSLSADTARVAFLRSDPRTPAEVFVAPAEDFVPRRLTTTNPQLEGFALARVEPISWQSRDGLDIDGLLMLPPGESSAGRLPLLTYVHGGPAGRFGAGFSPGLGESQPVQAEGYPLHSFAGRGFAILLPNPRGSNGYGEHFRKANRRDWGFGDYQDIMSGVDHLIARGIADPERLGMMGRSYGGYMTAWIITQTDRFAAASLGAAMVNLLSFYGQTDIPGYLEYYFEGDPWTARETYDRHSPISYAERVRTPTLIFQGEVDHRVPLPQAEELYRALRKQGVPVQLIILPRSGHVTTEPRLQRDTLKRNLEWFERWLAAGG